MRPGNLGHEFADDEAKNAKVKEMREKFIANSLPDQLNNIVKLLEGNGGKYACGDTFTIADLAFLRMFRHMTGGFVDHVPKTCLDTHPRVVQYMNEIMAVPEFAAWYAQEKRE